MINQNFVMTLKRNINFNKIFHSSLFIMADMCFIKFPLFYRKRNLIYELKINLCMTQNVAKKFSEIIITKY